MTLENGTANSCAAASLKGKVVLLNTTSASTKAAILEALEPHLFGCKTRLVDSYIMTKPSSPDLFERELRSVYIQEVLKSAAEGHTILLTTSLLDVSEGRRDIDNILSSFRDKQIRLSWVNVDCEPSDSEHRYRYCSYGADRPVSYLGASSKNVMFPSRTTREWKGIELVTRTLTAKSNIQDIVKELLDLAGSTR